MINDDGNNDPQTPPTEDAEDNEVPSKRQKRNKINSLNVNPSNNHSLRVTESESACLMREISAYRTRLSNTEASVIQLRKIRAEMETAVVEKAGMLEVQARMERDTIKHLQVRLETINGDESKATVKAEMSSMKSRIREQIELLLTENVRLNEHAMSSNSEETSTSPKPEESMELKLGQIVKKNMATTLDQANMPTQSTSVSSGKVDLEGDKTLLVARAHDLEEQLQSAKNMISTLREAVKEKLLLEEAVSTMTKRLQVAGAVKQCVVHGKCEESSSKVDDNETRVSEMSPAASKHETHRLQHGETTLGQTSGKQRSGGMEKKAGEFDSQAVKNESSSDANDNDNSQAEDGNKSPSSSQSHDNDQDKAASHQNLRVITRGYDVLVSHEKFFTIEWEKYYNRINCNEFRCKKCRAVKFCQQDIEDHIWVQHYGGAFKCPRCGDRSYSFSLRHSVVKHLRGIHKWSARKVSKKMKGKMMNTNDEVFGSQGINPKSSSNAKNNEDPQLAGEDKSPSTHQSDNSDKWTDEAEQSQQNCRLKIADYYVVVSHPKFFTMQWEKYSKEISRRKFACKKCSVVRQSRNQIHDHVWTQHCGGIFKCPLCSNPPRPFMWRHSVRKHLMTAHPNFDV